MASSLVNNKYRITRRIGGGSFGEIYMGIGPNNEKVAVKFERHGTRCPQLRHEYKVYRELINCHGFCQVYHFGTQDNYNVMVMDLLGPSLEDLFNKCNRRFSLKTVLQIADQMLERADTLHSRHLIHRDIKPANFVIGVGESASNVFSVDFGLSKRYRHPKNLQHIPHRDGRSLTGTPRYASINNHLGIEQSRRDDLESIGYVLIYFLKGSLPWQGLKAKNAQKKYRLILEKKQQVSIAQLCQGCPSQFAEFLAYTRSLKFDAKPDIPYLRKLFRDLYHAQNCGSIPKLWDWDGMDNDYNSTSGSAAGGQPAGGNVAPPLLMGGGGGMQANQGQLAAMNMVGGLRPTTAAAVAAPMAMDAGDILGNDQDELDDYEMGGQGNGGRPNTAGALLQSNYGAVNRGQQGGVAAVNPSWGYPRAGADNVAGSNAVASGSQLDPNRRPHTAHGARAGFPATGSAPQGQAMPSQVTGTYGVAMAEGEDGHVVAGAREMMRYRRNRTGADGVAPVGAAMPISAAANGMQSYGASGPAGMVSGAAGSNWAVYQQQQQGINNLKGATAGGPQMTAQQQAMLQQQQLAMRKPQAGVGTTSTPSTGAAGGWSYGAAPMAADGGVARPKSANLTSGAPVAQGPVGGMAGRPTTSGAPSVPAGGQWGSNAQLGSGQAAGIATSSNLTSGANGNNMLSYGSLKNRLLSGTTGKPAANAGTGSSGAPSALAAGAPPSSGVAGSAGASPGISGASSKPKLFSLAR